MVIENLRLVKPVVTIITVKTLEVVNVVKNYITELVVNLSVVSLVKSVIIKLTAVIDWDLVN